MDIDFEKDTTCTTASSPTDRISCSTDAELVGAATALRAAMPAGQYLLATATWAYGMYGEGDFMLSKPVADWLKTRGAHLALARSPAGQSLDLVTIMAYLAGWVGGNGWDWRECYRAHRVYWKTQAVAIGVMVTPAEGPADWWVQHACGAETHACLVCRSSGVSLAHKWPHKLIPRSAACCL